jgi:molybdopterin-guanine dinucleotide biosynthesis adapter protein
MNNAKVPILGFAAVSGTGKTTLLTQLIPLLKKRGLRIGLIKHSHHDIQIDQPGKDSYRLREAGASPVMLVSSHRRAIITEFTAIKEPVLDEELLAFDQEGLDLILVEGFKATPFPKIELHRPSLGKPLLYPNDPDIVAVASDIALELPSHLMPLDLNQPGQIAYYVINTFLNTP